MTLTELIAFVDSLLDPISIARYGDEATTIAMHALGVSRGSTIEVDGRGHVVYALTADEVEQRIRFVVEHGELPFYQAINLYYQDHPQPDPLEKLRSLL